MELSLVSVIATMSGVESKEHNTSFDRVRFFVKRLILQWKREIPLPWVVLNIFFSFDLYSDCGLFKTFSKSLIIHDVLSQPERPRSGQVDDLETQRNRSLKSLHSVLSRCHPECFITFSSLVIKLFLTCKFLDYSNIV